MIQKNGIANNFTMKGPINGRAPTRADRLAKACVNTPIVTVPKTTAYLSTPYLSDIIIAVIIIIHIIKCL